MRENNQRKLQMPEMSEVWFVSFEKKEKITKLRRNFNPRDNPRSLKAVSFDPVDGTLARNGGSVVTTFFSEVPGAANDEGLKKETAYLSVVCLGYLVVNLSWTPTFDKQAKAQNFCLA